MNLVLVTGGAGFIGSHTIVELLLKGYDVVSLDDYSNSSPKIYDRILKIVSGAPHKGKLFTQEGDLNDLALLRAIFKQYKINSVIHFAGKKAVGESVIKPLDYYTVNVSGTINLLRVMAESSVFRIVFSSSATVYGSEAPTPYSELEPRGKPSSPYGATKAQVEQILEDTCISDPRWQVIALRYFNPIGAHSSGLIGEDPKGLPNNLMPFVTQTAIGKRDFLPIFGDDYETEDGTCRRDYLHVSDLADGHLAAIEKIDHISGFQPINLGTGSPYSVLEIIKTFERVNEIRVNYKIEPRRAGDLPEFWADNSLASNLLGWKTKRTLEDMLEDSWRWQKLNPNGFAQ